MISHWIDPRLAFVICAALSAVFGAWWAWIAGYQRGERDGKRKAYSRTAEAIEKQTEQMCAFVVLDTLQIIERFVPADDRDDATRHLHELARRRKSQIDERLAFARQHHN